MNPLERKPDGVKLHVRFDERDLETSDGRGRMRHRLRKERQPMGQDLHAARQISTLQTTVGAAARDFGCERGGEV
jgi:hypothetical protein